MALNDYLQEFAGLPVLNWQPEQPLRDPARHAYRLHLDYEEGEKDQKWSDKLAAFLQQTGSDQVTHLVVGMWGSGEDVCTGDATTELAITPLIAAAERLPALKAIFLGDILSEDCEISWINQTDAAPLLQAYPRLEYFAVRGGQGLRFSNLQHPGLQTLVVQAGGLNANTVRDITSAQLPQLEHLELWLGEENYGGDAEIVDLAPLLTGKLFPRLKYLGLRNSEQADAIAAAVASSPVIERLETLDLSLGVLTDTGGAALLASPRLEKLAKLDLHRHYLSDEMMKKLLDSGFSVDVSEQEADEVYDDEVYRYVAVGE